MPRLTARSTARSAAGQVLFHKKDGETSKKAWEGDAHLRVEVPLSHTPARLYTA